MVFDLQSQELELNAEAVRAGGKGSKGSKGCDA